MNEKETLGIVAENVDILKRIRLVLSGVKQRIYIKR